MPALDEKALIAVVADISQLAPEKIDASAHFIEFMNSLLLVEVRSRVERLSGVIITDKDWGKIRCVKDLAGYLASKASA